LNITDEYKLISPIDELNFTSALLDSQCYEITITSH